MRIIAYQQLESSDCGITCVRIIARYYGRKLSLKVLRELCDISRIGISLKDVVDCTRKLEFESAAAKVTKAEIVKMPLPAIIYWNQEHYVVLYKIDKKKSKYYIADPAFGKMSFGEEVFMHHWKGDSYSGIAVVLSPLPEFYTKEYPKARKRIGLIDLLRSTIKTHKQKFTSVVIFTLIALIADIVMPMIFQRTIDEGIGGKNIGLVWILVLGQFGFFMGNYIANNIVEVILAKLGLTMSIQLVSEYLRKLITLPMSFFDSKVSSDLIQKVDDQNRIKNFLVNMPDMLFFSTLNLLVFSSLLIYYNYIVFFIFVISSVAAFLWNKLFLHRRREIDYSLFSYSSANRNNIYELINGMPEIKINNAQDIRIAVWNNIQEKINSLSLKSVFVNFYINSGNTLFLRLKDIIITGICATLVIQDSMTIGVMMTITYIVGRLSTPISQLVGSVNSVQDASMSYERLDEIINYPTECQTDLAAQPSQGYCRGIHLNNVSFKYPGSFSPFVINDVTVTIPQNKITAIVGASGSGKSTLIKLMLGFYTSNQGYICTDSLPISSQNNEQWLKQCGVVMQTGYIFSGTIMNNIALSDPKPNIERVKNAAKVACIDKFIENLPMSYNTKIGTTGIELSGGQKQRLFIARAIYKDPPFVFFDEATSSLDANNEREIITNMIDFYKGKTVIIVAHRLSTVKNADKIIFLDNGRVIEEGSHQELSKAKGAYYNLVKNQLELGD